MKFDLSFLPTNATDEDIFEEIRRVDSIVNKKIQCLTNKGLIEDEILVGADGPYSRVGNSFNMLNGRKYKTAKITAPIRAIMLYCLFIKAVAPWEIASAISFIFSSPRGFLSMLKLK